MPNDPIAFRIVQDLQTALRGIRKSAGYHHDVLTLAVKLDANHDVEALLGEEQLRPFVILELTPDEWIYYPSLQVRIVMPFTVHFATDADPTDDASWLRTYLRACADVEQALTQDITRGQLAIDTRITTREFHAYGGQQVWAMVPGQVTVQRTYGQPNG